jgi:fibronectin type 3 domain-containing protein
MTPGKPRVEHVKNHVIPAPIWERYFTYRMEWTPTALSFYVDGKLIRRETDPVEYAKILDPARAEPMNLRISLWAADNAWSGAFDSTEIPSAVDVNWAQVYSYTPGAGPNGSDFSLLWKDDFDVIDNSRWFFANWTFSTAVNDYSAAGARAANGYLQLKMTHWSEEGTRFTPSPIDDGLLKPPGAPAPPKVIGPLVVTELPNNRYTLPRTIKATKPTRYADNTEFNIGHSNCGTGALDVYTAVEGGCMVGGIQATEWLEYAVTTQEALNWNLSVRIAAGNPGSRFRVLVDGQPFGQDIQLPTSGWHALQNLPLGTIPLDVGEHLVRIQFLTSGMNFKSLSLTRLDQELVPELSLIEGPSFVPAVVLAKNYARANDLTPTNLGGGCRTGVVDLKIATDLYLDCNLGWSQAGEWVEYDVYTLNEGTFDLGLRITSALAGKTVQVSVNGVELPNTLVAPNLGWNTFATVPAGSVQLPAGTSRVRLLFPQGDVNFHWLKLTKSAPIAAPPEVVSGLSASPGQGSVSLAWQTSANATQYTIERSVDGGLNFTSVRSQVQVAWIDTDVEAGITYTYRVIAKGESSDADPSTSVSATPEQAAPVLVPQNILATAGDAQVTLTWAPVAGATGYVVLRGVVGGTLLEVSRPTSTSWTSLGLVNGTGYAFSVVTLQGTRSSEPSIPVVATPLGLPPAAVASVSATAGNNLVVLAWPSSARATGYTIQRAVAAGEFVEVAVVATTTWRDESVTNGTSYTYRIVATNAEGIAPSSSPVTATPVEPPPVVASIRLEYQVGNTAASTNGIRPLFRVVNTGSQPISLAGLKIRYWFTRDGATSNNYWCDWAQVGTANVQGTFTNLASPRTGADTYLEIGFRAPAGTLAPGASTGEIQSRFSMQSWSNFNQANDASFDLTATSYRASDKATAYLDGVLVWGTEP